MIFKLLQNIPYYNNELNLIIIVNSNLQLELYCHLFYNVTPSGL